MPRVVISRALPVDAEAILRDALGEEGLEVVVLADGEPARPDALRAAVSDADALVATVSDRIDAGLLDAAPRLRIVASYAVGYDQVDVDAATSRGVWVTNTPDVLTDATADLAFTLVLAVARRVREGEALVRSGRWGGWAPGQLLGLELAGSTLGIFGFGRIGQAVARRATAFGMRVRYTSRSEVPDPPGGAVRVDRATLLAESDVLSLHAPLTPQTRHVLDEAALASMKPGAIVINTARGPLIDEVALAAALARGHLAGAGLDVFEREPRVHPALLDRDDVVLLPHLGSATGQTRRRMAEIALGNVAAVLRGESPDTPVHPPLPAPRH